MNRYLFSLIIAVFLWVPNLALAKQESIEVTSQVLSSENPYNTQKVNESDEFLFEANKDMPSTTKLMTQTLFFLIVLASVAFGVLYLSKKGRLSLPSRNREGGLKVCETKMLGNKQFLMVVEYGDQKMLLGVGPGMINHLCYLNDEETTNVKEEAFSVSSSY